MTYKNKIISTPTLTFTRLDESMQGVNSDTYHVVRNGKDYFMKKYKHFFSFHKEAQIYTHLSQFPPSARYIVMPEKTPSGNIFVLDQSIIFPWGSMELGNYIDHDFYQQNRYVQH